MTESLRIPLFTLDDYDDHFADRHLLHGVLAKWAQERPESLAILSAEGNRAITWGAFDRFTTAMAIELLRLGIVKGDFLVTLLPMSVDHVLLEYACFKIGVIVAPLDLRLSSAEVLRSLDILRPRGFVALGVKAPIDLRALWSMVQKHCLGIQQLIAVDSDEAIPGARSFASIADPLWKRLEDAVQPADQATLAEIALTPDDGALVIFTPARPDRPNPHSSRIAISRCRICASAARSLAGTMARARWSICLPRTSEARPRR